MPKLIKDGVIVDDQRQLVAKDASLSDVSGAHYVVPLALWLANKAKLSAQGVDAVWIDSDETAEQLGEDTAELALIAVNFPAFADGRGFSTGRLLRERFKFTGELRAVGQVIQDQAHFLLRCGFNALDLRAGTNLESALASLSDFSEHYQCAVDKPKPLFARRT